MKGPLIAKTLIKKGTSYTITAGEDSYDSTESPEDIFLNKVAEMIRLGDKFDLPVIVQTDKSGQVIFIFSENTLLRDLTP